MKPIDVLRLRYVQVQACRRAGRMATELVHATSEEREEILAAMEFDRWLAESCDDAIRPV